MPYISEELWQRLPFPGGKLPAESICIASFPKDY